MNVLSDKLKGILMAALGFVLVIINAMSYLLDWEVKSPVSSIIGLVLVTIGLKRARMQG